MSKQDGDGNAGGIDNDKANGKDGDKDYCTDEYNDNKHNDKDYFDDADYDDGDDGDDHGVGDDDDAGDDDEKQVQWLTLKLCLVTVGATKWIECSRYSHLF